MSVFRRRVEDGAAAGRQHCSRSRTSAPGGLRLIVPKLIPRASWTRRSMSTPSWRAKRASSSPQLDGHGCFNGRTLFPGRRPAERFSTAFFRTVNHHGAIERGRFPALFAGQGDRFRKQTHAFARHADAGETVFPKAVLPLCFSRSSLPVSVANVLHVPLSERFPA